MLKSVPRFSAKYRVETKIQTMMTIILDVSMV
jgi:hypothetical protein